MKPTNEYDKKQLEILAETIPEEKRWENLTLQNRFMFAKVMSNEELCAELLRRLFPDMNIGYVRVIEAEKTMETGWDTHGIRLDVYAESGEKIFDAEMQAQKTPALPKRSRYYHGTIDVTNLERGASYDELQDTFVIFICPFDLYGKGRHIYTFRNLCTEDPEIELEDGTTTIFLNASGLMEDIPGQLKAFLDYVRGALTASETSDDFIHRLDEEVRKARRNKEWRREYMMSSIYERDAFLIGRNEGLEAGERKGREEGERRGREEGERKGREEGERRGLQYGKEILAGTLRELGQSEEEIERILCEKYPQKEPEPLMAREETAPFIQGVKE